MALAPVTFPSASRVMPPKMEAVFTVRPPAGKSLSKPRRKHA